MSKAEETWEQAAEALRERLGIDLDLPHLSEALTHPSFTNERRLRGEVDNQRLEFLGDAVLGLCVSELLMEAFGDVDEGDLTVMRAALVNAEALAAGARALDLAAALRLGRGADVAGERHRTNVLADALEAVIAAVYLGGGLEAAREVSRLVIGDRLDELLENGGIERDAKSRLQELAQAQGLGTPGYQIVAVEGPPHAHTFTAEVSVVEASAEAVDEARVEADRGGEASPAVAAQPVIGRGRGQSKKAAEQAAARSLLAALDPASQSGDDD
ncbi:MAG: ribonuclease III [Deltaproteobacteria bacterium]|nr:ribonuclease III [Deltaproteobacteria bacterium]